MCKKTHSFTALQNLYIIVLSMCVCVEHTHERLSRERGSVADMQNECTLCLKPERQHDPHYRYKMPPLEVMADSRTKQRKTHLPNLAAVAKNIFRPEAWVVKYLALSNSTDSGSSSSSANAYLTGHHAADQLQQLIFSFIYEYVLCKCGSPETLLYVEGKKRNKVGRLRCHSCGRCGKSAGQDEKMLNILLRSQCRRGCVQWVHWAMQQRFTHRHTSRCFGRDRLQLEHHPCFMRRPTEGGKPIPNASSVHQRAQRASRRSPRASLVTRRVMPSRLMLHTLAVSMAEEHVTSIIHNHGRDDLAVQHMRSPHSMSSSV